MVAGRNTNPKRRYIKRKPNIGQFQIIAMYEWASKKSADFFEASLMTYEYLDLTILDTGFSLSLFGKVELNSGAKLWVWWAQRNPAWRDMLELSEHSFFDFVGLAGGWCFPEMRWSFGKQPTLFNLLHPSFEHLRVTVLSVERGRWGCFSPGCILTCPRRPMWSS